MKENEEHHIAAISEDGYTITLTEPLKYRHISIEQTFDDKVVETRGEVGLLTRNILIKGTINEQFTEVLPACDQEFSSGGAFSDAMQTCFAGKFGEELGTDEMGAVIIISPKFKDQGLVSARFEYVELILSLTEDQQEAYLQALLTLARMTGLQIEGIHALPKMQAIFFVAGSLGLQGGLVDLSSMINS